MTRRFSILVAFVVVLTTSVMAGNDAKTGTNVGDKAPNIIEQSVDGKEMKLSDLKGQVVLIDFWASWCGPCRHENPTVVNAYETFKDKEFKNGKGFTVFSVSLDKNKTAWQNAIKKDKLSWEYHVSDLGGWNSQYARVYGVRGIPANYLIDGDGVIVATTLRGPSLNKALEKLLK